MLRYLPPALSTRRPVSLLLLFLLISTCRRGVARWSAPRALSMPDAGRRALFIPAFRPYEHALSTLLLAADALFHVAARTRHIDA